MGTALTAKELLRSGDYACARIWFKLPYWAQSDIVTMRSDRKRDHPFRAMALKATERPAAD
jgi:hypothetical protein